MGTKGIHVLKSIKMCKSRAQIPRIGIESLSFGSISVTIMQNTVRDNNTVTPETKSKPKLK